MGVQEEERFTNFLEKGLLNKGYNIETLNFGIAGYGIHQYYWLFTSESKRYKPDVVRLRGLWIESIPKRINMDGRHKQRFHLYIPTGSYTPKLTSQTTIGYYSGRI